MNHLAIAGSRNGTIVGISFVLLGMVAISINNVLFKQLAGDYPLPQITFLRSAIAICFCMGLLQLQGGFAALATASPWLNAIRVTLIVVCNLTFFAALAVVPLADATALFFMAPLLITLLSIPLLGETPGRLKLFAVGTGFVGTVILLRPWAADVERSASIIVLMLPLIAALTYAVTQVLTRRLGLTTSAAAMAVYIQAMFIAVSAFAFVIAGDGRFASDAHNANALFLLNAWVWPNGADRLLFIGLGLCAAVIAYALSEAYRLARAATLAPFEYVGLPLAMLWGWMLWRELPGAWGLFGMILIVAGGLLVFLQERITWKWISPANVKSSTSDQNKGSGSS